jgi:hypothetical protein
MHRKNVHIAEPCDASWNEMSGDDARRFCDHCTKHVHNLSEMPRSEATKLVSSGQNLCVRYASTPAGRVKFKARTVRATAPVGQLIGARALQAAALSVAVLAGCDWPLSELNAQEHGNPPDETLAGGIEAPPEEFMGEAYEIGEMAEEPCEGSAAIEGSGMTTVPPGPPIDMMVQGAVPMPEHLNTTTTTTDDAEPCDPKLKEGDTAGTGDVDFDQNMVAGMMAFEPPTVEVEPEPQPVAMGRMVSPRPSYTPEEVEANAGNQLEPFGIVIDDTEIDDSHVDEE